jgi:hypothetical protein
LHGGPSEGLRRHPTLHLCWYESASVTILLDCAKNHIATLQLVKRRGYPPLR